MLKGQKSTRPKPMWKDMVILEHDDVSVRVRELTLEGRNGPRYAVELSLDAENPRERAVLDGESREEVNRLLHTAAYAFAAAARLRQKAKR